MRARPSVTPTKPQVACLLAENCKGDATCQSESGRGNPFDAKNYGNANVPGCLP